LTASANNNHLDTRLHLERLPAETVYFAEHALELGQGCIGLVFRDPTTKDVTLVFDKAKRTLNESEARRLLNPS
jgi:hypothetical protein